MRLFLMFKEAGSPAVAELSPQQRGETAGPCPPIYPHKNSVNERIDVEEAASFPCSSRPAPDLHWLSAGHEQPSGGPARTAVERDPPLPWHLERQLYHIRREDLGQCRGRSLHHADILCPGPCTCLRICRFLQPPSGGTLP